MKNRFTIIFTIIFITINLQSQSMRIMTYNVENLFDTRHDIFKNDEEYTPSSKLHWNNKRFNDKLQDIMQTIIGIGIDDELPILVGLCEIENDYVLKAMTSIKPYNKLNYDYIHFESPDKRGIDVALLYQKEIFNPLTSRPIPVILPNGKQGRDLLYVCGEINNEIIVHIIQVHFPSRREGAIASQPNRISAGKAVMNVVDSIKKIDPKAAIIIMGDFNDNPNDIVPSTIINALPYINENYNTNNLYNLCWDGYKYEDKDIGSYFHAGEWDMLDQIIVSGALLNNSLSMVINPKARIFNPTWLSINDYKSGNRIPNRTYTGPYYKGGTSDHFPIYIDVVVHCK